MRSLLSLQSQNEVARFDGIIISDPNKDVAFRDTALAALKLIKDLDPRRFRRIQRHIKWVVNVILPHGGARYSWSTRTCKIDFEKTVWQPYESDAPFVCAADLVHEATHGELHARGIPYSPELRGRVERLCVRESQRFLTCIQSAVPRAAIYAREQFDESQWHVHWHDSLWRSFCAFVIRVFRDWKAQQAGKVNHR